MKKLLILLSLPGWLAAQPAVIKVEPPDWWLNSTASPIRLLVRGRNLQDAKVTCDLKLSRVSVNARGSYLFADIFIPPSTKPGAHPINIRTSRGSAIAAFNVLPARAFTTSTGAAGFTPDDLIYLIMPDRFANGDPRNDQPLFDPAKPHYYHGGDFAGIRNRLAYFKQLGITALWLNPWYDNVNHLNEREKSNGEPVTDYHGYGAVDFYGVEEHFGSLDELKRLVSEAHLQGLKVIQDEVANHTGPYHPWVDDPPTPTWFHGTADHHPNETWQLWPLLDPHATKALKSQTLDGWFADILPDLNQDDPEVARYLIQNTLWWIGITGIDAIRMDTLPYVPRAFWGEWMAAIRKEFPGVNVVGEVFDADPALTSSYQQGSLTVFDFPSYFKVRDVIANGKGTMRDLAGLLAHDALYQNPGQLVTFIGNHDVKRFMSEEGATPERLKLAFTWLLTTRGTPVIYYGDEIGMQGGADPDNRRDFPISFTPAQQSTFDFVSQLCHLRAATPALRTGELITLCASDQTWTYARVLPNQVAIVELNISAAAVTPACDLGPLKLPAPPAGVNSELAPVTGRISITSR